MCIDTRVASAPADIMPRHKPHLHKIQSKDPIEAENKGYVSNSYNTGIQSDIPLNRVPDICDLHAIIFCRDFADTVPIIKTS